MRYHPFRQLGLKILALTLASVLWLTVAGEHVVERSLRVPLEFRNIPEALEIVGNTPDTVDVRLRGSSAVLSRVQPGEIVAVVTRHHLAVVCCALRSCCDDCWRVG